MTVTVATTDCDDARMCQDGFEQSWTTRAGPWTEPTAAGTTSGPSPTPLFVPGPDEQEDALRPGVPELRRLRLLPAFGAAGDAGCQTGAGNPKHLPAYKAPQQVP